MGKVLKKFDRNFILLLRKFEKVEGNIYRKYAIIVGNLAEVHIMEFSV